ncbi:Hypothetical protein CAP_0823 [Chondromyces apiculatus DSM 436]|uniref:Uncharacterized protein n=1 Tax=Chondromyces apiculatus DSM 436 TaxID=1192034 RepID=A0A017SU13_9BACT|nr:Hypothetical protein CAP_0823 [Chondromyces apiculatus DSM 436]
MTPTSERIDQAFSIVTPSGPVRVQGRIEAMRRGEEVSRKTESCVEVVRDDGRLTFIFWDGMLQGCVQKR